MMYNVDNGRLSLVNIMSDPSIQFTHDQLFSLLGEFAEALLVANDAGHIQYMNPPAQRLVGLLGLKDCHVDELRHSNQLDLEPLPVDIGALCAFRVSARQMAQPDNIFHRQQCQSLLDLGDRIPIGLVAIDADGQVLDFNHTAETLLGHPRTRARGRPITNLLTDFDKERHIAAVDSTAVEPALFTYRHREADLLGQLFPFDTGTSTVYLLSLIDITPLEKHHAIRTGLLRLMIHDLNNPLSIALNFSSLLQHSPVTTDETHQAKAVIATQLHRMQQLLKDLSLLDQLMENIKQSFEVVDLDIMVAIVINDLVPYAQEHEVNLRLNPLPFGECRTMGNERLLRQAVYNLVENAIKYTRGGWVRVTLRPKDEWLQVLVADNGIGIPPDKQPYIHRPFFRAQDPNGPHTNGSGLGLSLVHMIARQHDARVWLHSIPGSGSIFALHLKSYEP